MTLSFRRGLVSLCALAVGTLPPFGTQQSEAVHLILSTNFTAKYTNMLIVKKNLPLGVPEGADEEFCQQMIRQCAHIDLIHLIRSSAGISCYDLTNYRAVSTLKTFANVHV